MAELAVRSVVQKLGNLIVQEAIDLHGVRDQVKWLERELRRIQCFLKDADAKKNKGGINGERVKNWVTEMRDVAFDAEDIIDTYMDLKLRRQQKDGCIGFIERYVFILVELIGLHKVHVDLKAVQRKMHELSQSRISYGIANIGETIGPNSQTRSQHMIPILPQLNEEIDIIGFDDEKEKIVQELVAKTNTNRSVISIVGMGGLGKTTLAKSIYNDPKVNKNFDRLAWVNISQEYNILEIVKKILCAVSLTSSGDTIETLSAKPFKELKIGKYLVVLDDVWEENVWDQLQKVFPEVNNGSRVIITTRFLNVAKKADPTTQPHELRLLNENESWELFLRRVFPRQNIDTCCPIYLFDSAHKLVKRCKGLPLALRVLGGYVSTRPKSKDAWEKVVRSMKWQFVEGGERCLEILALSYEDLPCYLKSCFLYFACFPQDMVIPAKTLIRLWSAEGFLPTKNGKTIEEVGMDCLDELVQRCMIQITKRKYDDNASYCQIHDLLRDMCISEAKENRYLEIYRNDNANCGTKSNAARRLIISHEIETLNYSNSKLRGLFHYNEYIHNPLAFKALNEQFSGFKLLRVLYLNSLDMSEFPGEIKSLIHLRYLELHAHVLKEVPSWICHLRNLQTFVVHCQMFLAKISDSLWTIDSLRHVDVRMSSSVTPPNMGNVELKNLETLKWVPAGEWIGKMLPKLTNLRKLNITNISDDHADELSSSFQKFVQLASLTIQGDEIPLEDIITAFSNQHCLKKLYIWGNFNCKQLPCNDVFPQQLVKLILINSQLEQDPMATLEKLPFLKYLSLEMMSYRGKKMICSATGFPQLLSLTIVGFYALREWEIEEKAMPCLMYLHLAYCSELKVIPEGLKNVPLDQLVLRAMPEELIIRIENTREDWSKIQHVPNFSIRP